MRPIRQIIGRKLFKDTVAFQAQTFASIVISLLTSIALTRILGKDDYGTYAMVIFVFNLLNIGRYISPGIVVINRIAEANASKKPDEIKEAIAYYLKVSLITGGLVAILGAAFGPALAKLIYGKEVAHLAVRLIFLSVFLSIISDLTIVIFQGMRMMLHFAVFNTIQLAMRLVLITAFLVMRFGVPGVVYAYLLSALLGSLTGILFLHKARKDGNEFIPNTHDVFFSIPRAALKMHFGFMTMTSLNKQATTLISIVPALMLGRYAEKSEVGFYNLGLHIVGALWSVFLGFAGNLLPYMSEIKGRDNMQLLKQRFRKVTLYSGLASIVIAGAFALIAKYAVLIVYGKDYLPVVPVIYVMLLQYVLCSFGIAANSYYIVTKRVLFALLSKVVLLFVSIPFGWWLVKAYGALGAGIFYSVLLSFVEAVYLSDIFLRMRKDAG